MAPPVLIDLVAQAAAAAAAPAVSVHKVNNIAYTCQGAVTKLKDVQRSSNLDCWSQVVVCTVGEGEARTPKLKCKHCNRHLAVSNPSQVLKTHLTSRGCTGLRRLASAEAAREAAVAAATATAAGAGGGGGGSSSITSTNSTITVGGTVGAASVLGKRKRGSALMMCATADQQQCFEKSIARFFFKNGIPLQLTEDPDLKAAVAHVGLMPPSRAALSNKLLDDEYNAVRAADSSTLALQRFLQFSSDGWRRRAAVQGKPLINFMALPAVGKPIFCKVISAAGEVKDKHWIAARHVEWAAEFTDGNLDRVLGFVMDNTKANM